MDAAQGLQFGSAWVLNLALAALLGILSAWHWLAGAPWAAGIRGRLDAVWRPTALACLAGQFSALWSAAATMAGVPPGEALPALWTMLTATAFGKAGLLGLSCAALLAIAGPVLLRGRGASAVQSADVIQIDLRRAGNGQAVARAGSAGAWAGDGADPGAPASGGTRWRAVAALLLAVFAAARVANSHAAENGLLSVGMLIEWLHLVLVCLWLGGVAVAAWMVMPDAPTAPVRYMQKLSDAATIAIVGILATGVYNAWHGLGVPANALGNPYGSALLVKIALVLAAAALGGYNKLVAFERAATGDVQALRRARLVLQIESIVLAGAMFAAAVLVAQQPPAMA